jgi:hypothetical protein
MKQIFDVSMNVIDKYDPEKRTGDQQLFNHLTNRGIGGILADGLFKTANLKYPD